MALVDDVRGRLSPSYLAYAESPAAELGEYRKAARQLLDEFKIAPPPDPAIPTNPAYCQHAAVVGELQKLIQEIDLTLPLLKTLTPQQTCKVYYRAMGWPLNEVSKMSAEHLREAERAILWQAAVEVSQLVTSLASRSRFFSLVVARERRSAIGLKAASKANAIRSANRPDYLAAVQEVMAMGVDYIPACEQVAAQFDVSWQTVRNNTPSLRPRRPLKKR